VATCTPARNTLLVDTMPPLTYAALPTLPSNSNVLAPVTVIENAPLALVLPSTLDTDTLSVDVNPWTVVVVITIGDVKLALTIVSLKNGHAT
jgi:hypothetical protein